MLKKYLKIIVLLILIIPVISGCSQNNSVKFDNQNYILQFSKKSPSTNGYINEYIKPEENIKNWTEMIGVYNYPNATSPTKLAREMATLVKLTNPQAGVSLMNNKDGKAAIVDFLSWAPSKETGKIDFLEFDVFKFQTYKNNSVISLQYARKYATKDIKSTKDFTKNLKETRKKYLNMLLETPIPKIVAQDINIKPVE